MDVRKSVNIQEERERVIFVVGGDEVGGLGQLPLRNVLCCHRRGVMMMNATSDLMRFDFGVRTNEEWPQSYISCQQNARRLRTGLDCLEKNVEGICRFCTLLVCYVEY